MGSQPDARQPATERTPRALADIVATLLDRAVTSLETDPASCRELLARATELLATSRSLVRGEPPSVPWRVRNILTHIEKTLPGVVRVDELAELTAMSSSLFFRTFKAAMGASPRQYITRRRVELACSMMLSSRERLSEIAVASGFYDQSQLCRAFRKTLGVSPGSWRRQRIAQRYGLTSSASATG